MDAASIKPGVQYAYRRSPRSADPPQRLEILERVTNSRGKWKVKFLDDPYPGLVEYVRSVSIICRWSEVKRLLRHERAINELRTISDRAWPGSNDPLTDAVETVLDATGEDPWIRNDGLLDIGTAALQRLADRAHITLDDFDTLVTGDTTLVAFGSASRLAVAFASSEPGTVHAHLGVMQRQYEIDATRPGNAYLAPLVNRWRAGWALARQWAGHDSELESRDLEIKRLREIIDRHLVDLRRRLPDNIEADLLAKRLERALAGR